jgi:hypothetical protein
MRGIKEMKKITKYIVASVFAFLVLLMSFGTALAGLGISPAQMTVPNLSKGSHIEKTFTLSRSDPKEDLYFKVTMEGKTKDWTTLDKGMEFTMPAGAQTFPVVVTANIPKDTANGDYSGGIHLVSSSKSPDDVNGTGASTTLSAFIQTNFKVISEQVLSYEVSSIEIKNIKQGTPLDTIVIIINTGNVEAKPTKVKVEIYDKYNLKLLESHEVTKMGSVKPFTTGNIGVSVPTKLGIDQYWARISVYKDETVIKNQSLVFEIVKNEKREIMVKIAVLLIVLAVIGAIVAVVIFIKKKRKKAKKSNERNC